MNSITKQFNQTVEQQQSFNPCESCGSDVHGYKPCDYGYHCSKANSQSFYIGGDGYVFSSVYH